MSVHPVNQALTHQAPGKSARLDRARNLIQKRERRIAELEAENERLTAERDDALARLAACSTAGRIHEPTEGGTR